MDDGELRVGVRKVRGGVFSNWINSELKVGDTLPLEMRPDALVAVRCGDVTLTEGRMGRVGDRVAIRVTKQLRKPHTTFAMFEKADEQTKLMEAQ